VSINRRFNYLVLLYSSFISTFTLANTEDAFKSSTHQNPPIKVTIIGDYNYAPYSYVEDGKIIGLYPLILNQIFSRMKDYQVNLSMMPWKRGLSMIENNVSLGIFPPYFGRLNAPISLAILNLSS